MTRTEACCRALCRQYGHNPDATVTADPFPMQGPARSIVVGRTCRAWTVYADMVDCVLKTADSFRLTEPFARP